MSSIHPDTPAIPLNTAAQTSASTISHADADASACPCGSGQPLSACCGPLLQGNDAATPEALMRSRYTAYALHDASYLNRTHHPSTLDPALKESLADSFNECRWTGLRITGKAAGKNPDEGYVRFEAHFTQAGKPHVLREHSRFVREDGRWFYIDGDGRIDAVNLPQPGRNDPCWCGSGKKFKKCHGG